MNRTQVIQKTAWWIAALLFMGAAVGLERYYLYFSEDNLKAVKNTTERFYQKLHPHWLKLSVDAMIENLQHEKTDELYLMILQTALGRWRLRETAPHAYSQFIQSLRSGWWGDAFAADLAPALQKMDDRWLKARKIALDKADDNNTATLVMHSSHGMVMGFTPGTTTADLGSVIEARFTVMPGPETVNAGDAVWGTARHPEAASWRVRSYTVEKTKDINGTLPIYRLTMDMSDSPLWIDTTTEPTWIHFRGPVATQWTPIDYSFSDAPTLTVPAPMEDSEAAL